MNSATRPNNAGILFALAVGAGGYYMYKNRSSSTNKNTKNDSMKQSELYSNAATATPPPPRHTDAVRRYEDKFFAADKPRPST
jgi:uncharacterized protein HemX